MSANITVPEIKGNEILQRIEDTELKLWRYRLSLPEELKPEDSHGILYEIVLPMDSGTELECLEAFLVDQGESEEILQGYKPEKANIITGDLFDSIGRAMIQSWHKLFVSISATARG